MCRHKSGYSETTRENTGVTYVFAFANFYDAAKRIRRFAVPTHALRRYKSSHSATVVPKRYRLYVADFTNFFGAAKRIRTPDPRITNALLYQLSYCGALP
jgi:hypothetical protein